jgi:4-aminobutyrate aminotransferase-like enzyme
MEAILLHAGMPTMQSTDVDTRERERERERARARQYVWLMNARFRVAMTSIQVLIDEQLCERSAQLGDLFGKLVRADCQYDWIKDIRGKGLFYAIEIDPNHKVSAANAPSQSTVVYTDPSAVLLCYR